MRDWFGYWSRVYEDPEAYARHYGGGCYEDEDDDWGNDTPGLLLSGE